MLIVKFLLLLFIWNMASIENYNNAQFSVAVSDCLVEAVLYLCISLEIIWKTY